MEGEGLKEKVSGSATTQKKEEPGDHISSQTRKVETICLKNSYLWNFRSPRNYVAFFDSDTVSSVT